MKSLSRNDIEHQFSNMHNCRHKGSLLSSVTFESIKLLQMRFPTLYITITSLNPTHISLNYIRKDKDNSVKSLISHIIENTSPC